MLNPINPNDPYEQLIAQIIRIESQPQQLLKQRRVAQEKAKAVLSDMDSKLSALHTLVKELTTEETNPFAARTVTGGTFEGFSVAAGDEASLGSHTLSVTQLARADSRYSYRYDADSEDLRSFFDTYGAQTFSIEVASSTDEDPDNRVSIDVTVDPTGTTNKDILDEIVDAIDAAMAAAVDDETIGSTEKAVAQVMRETSDTARLSLRSPGTGYASRLSFTDSADGLLAALELTRTDKLGEGTVDKPARAATTRGAELTAPVTIDGSNEGLDLTVDGAARSVTIANGTYNTLEDLAAALNTAIGNDVVVSVVGDALRIDTVATGVSASIKFTGGNGLTAIGFAVMADPVTGTDAQSTPATEANGGLQYALGSDDTTSELSAIFTLDGLTHYRASNAITDAIDGVTLDLLEAGNDAEEFSIAADREGIKSTAEGFIKKYNALVNHIQQQTKVDAEEGTRGALAGDSLFTQLRFSLRNDVVQSVSGQPEDAPAYLSDLGITLEEDGTLSLSDADALEEAVARDAEAVQSFFNGDDGIATRVFDRLDRFVGNDGILDGRIETYDDRIERLDDRIDDWDDRLAQRTEMLRAQYAKFQETIALLQGQNNMIGGFFGIY